MSLERLGDVVTISETNSHLVANATFHDTFFYFLMRVEIDSSQEELKVVIGNA